MVQQPFFGRFIDSRGVGTGLRGGSMEFLLFKTFYDWELEDKMVWMDSKYGKFFVKSFYSSLA